MALDSYSEHIYLKELFNPELVGLIYIKYDFHDLTLEEINRLNIDSEDVKNKINVKASDEAEYITCSLYEDILAGKLDPNEINIEYVNASNPEFNGEIDEYGEYCNEQIIEMKVVSITRKGIKSWFDLHKKECPKILLPRHLQSEQNSSSDEMNIYAIKHENQRLQAENLQLKAENKEIPDKWRKAFGYESVGLNALYDMIEEYYLDENGKQIDLKDLPYKKNIESEWLSGRTRDEADIIITSGARRGKAT